MTNIRDIARLAGVSPSTVSRALNGHPQIAETTRKRIETLATDFHYVPNRLSHGVFTGDSGLLGCITHPNIGPGFAETVQGVMTQAYEAGFGIITMQPVKEPPFIYQAVRTLLGMRVQGIIFAHAGAPILPDDLLFTIRSSGVYLVELSHNLTDSRVDQVAMDFRSAFELLTDYLYRLGHRVVSLFHSPSRRDDYPGIMAAACKPRGMRLVQGQQVHAVSELESAFDAAMAMTPRPTALVIQNEQFAWKALLLAEQRRVRIPEDVSLLSMGDYFHGFVFPELTAINPHYREVGHEAVKLLCRRIRDKVSPAEVAPAAIAIPPEIVVRRTVAPPPRPQ